MKRKGKVVEGISTLKNKGFYILFIAMLVSIFAFNNKKTSDVNLNTFCLSSEEVKLYNMINDYRIKHKLPPIELSKSLSFVAKTHAIDFEKYGNPRDENCNLHSWSDNGNWEGMCYSDDHKMANLMWSKPQELTNYTGVGYELAAKTTGKMTPDLALHLWKNSSGHNNVIANLKNWKGIHWNAIGIGIYKGYACVWFGEEYDEEGEPMACY